MNEIIDSLYFLLDRILSIADRDHVSLPAGEGVWRCADRVKNGRNSTCSNSVTISEMELKNNTCRELGVSGFDKQMAKDNIEVITIGVHGLEF